MVILDTHDLSTGNQPVDVPTTVSINWGFVGIGRCGTPACMPGVVAH